MSDSVPPTSVSCGANRMSAVGIIKDRIRRLEDEAGDLRCLLEDLPDLSPEGDSAIWRLVIQQKD